MKDKIDSPVFIVFLVGAFVFACITFVLGIWFCDSSHKIDKQFSNIKVVDDYSDEITADDLNVFNDNELEKSNEFDINETNKVGTLEKSDNSNKSNEKKTVVKDIKNNNVVKERKKTNLTKKKTTKQTEKVKVKKSTKKVTTKKPTKKKTTKRQTIKKQYYVQIIATSKKEVANKEKRKLERKGYNVFLITDTKGKSTIYKVRIGTFNTKAQANKIAAKISKEYKIKPWVL